MTTKTATAMDALGEEQLGLFLYQMILLRRFEERTGEMYTKGKVRGFLHLYTGQEACAVGAINALSEQDQIITHYRDHGHALARGVDPDRIMAELSASGARLVSLNPIRPTLEDLFVEQVTSPSAMATRRGLESDQGADES